LHVVPHTPAPVQIGSAFGAPGQGVVESHVPELLQVCVPVPEHCLAFGTHTPVQAPFKQT